MNTSNSKRLQVVLGVLLLLIIACQSNVPSTVQNNLDNKTPCQIAAVNSENAAANINKANENLVNNQRTASWMIDYMNSHNIVTDITQDEWTLYMDSVAISFDTLTVPTTTNGDCSTESAKVYSDFETNAALAENKISKSNLQVLALITKLHNNYNVPLPSDQ